MFNRMSRSGMKSVLVLLVFSFLSHSVRAEISVWALKEHLDAVDKIHPPHHYNEKTGEISMRGNLGLKYNTLQFYPNVKIEENMAIKFNVRREIDFHQKVSFAIMLSTQSGADYYLSDAISEKSKSYVLDLATLRNKEGELFEAGDHVTELRLYTTNKKLVSDMNMNFSVQNFRFVIENGEGPPVEDGIFYSVIPHFQWASQDAESQRFQLARTPDFYDVGSLHDVQLMEPQYVPEEDLDPGTWYWRYYRKDHLSDRWSDVHQFIVSEKAHTFRLPEIDFKALGEKPHPRFAGLAGALLAEEQLNTRVKESVDTPFPKDGVARVGSDLSKIDWLRTVGRGVVSPTSTRLKELGQYLLVTNDLSVKESARERLMEVATWDPKGASSVRSNDLGAGNFLIGMCWLFDAIYEDLTPSEREKVMDSIEARCDQFADAGVVPFTLNPAQNHSWKKAEALGVGAMVLLGHRDRARYWFESVRNAFAYRILPSMGFEGENQEGISYWRYGGEMLAEFADVLKAFSGDNLYEHPWLKSTVDFPIYSAPPGGYTISFADTHGNGNHSLRGPYTLYGADRYMAHLTQKTGFPYGAWYLGRSISGAENQRPPFDVEPSKYWDHIGWTLFNTCLPNGYENVSVGLHSGKYFAGHQHADQNSFVINAYGDKLAIDGGCYDWYGSPHYKAYAIYSMAHNTILVNGEGQAWRTDGADGAIDTFYSSIPYDYTVGDASDPDIYQGNLPLFKRKLLFIKPDYVVIHDQLIAKEKDTEFDWLLHSHTEAPIAVNGTARSFSIVRPFARLDGQFLFPENIGLEVNTSYTNMPCKMYSLELRDPELLSPEWTLFGKTETTNAASEYFVVMRISKTSNDAPLDLTKFETDTALGVTLRDNGRIFQILSRRSGQKNVSLNAKGLVSDADIACVELDGKGVVQSTFMGQGTQLSFNGKSVLQESGVANAHSNVQEEWHHKRLDTVSLIEGLPPFNAYVSQINHGSLYMYSVETEVPSNTVYTVDLTGINSPVYLHVNGEINAIPASGEISLEAGSWFMTISSRSDLRTTSVRPALMNTGVPR